MISLSMPSFIFLSVPIFLHAVFVNSRKLVDNEVVTNLMVIDYKHT